MTLELYPAAISRTAAMSRNSKFRSIAESHGLRIQDVTWEDVGRTKGSCWGPNISDMTIQVENREALTCMPVIRTPNFSDVTCDIDPAKFFLRVGNQTEGAENKVISLAEYLENIGEYLSSPESGKIKGNLLDERDSHVLVSAQACFLPVPKEGKAEFTPVLFNYQTRADDPAILSILVTVQGTSATIIDNSRDTGSSGWSGGGQRIFLNKDGEKCALTGERFEEVKEREEEAKAKAIGPVSNVETVTDKTPDLVLLIQVPLKQKPMPEPASSNIMYGAGYDSVETLGGGMAYTCSAPLSMSKSLFRGVDIPEVSDVDKAVIGAGESRGAFVELDEHEIERDTDYPIRVTVQLYKATSNGVIDEKDVRDIAETIDRIYKDADYVGSLVTKGETTRPTEHAGKKHHPVPWWPQFWPHHLERAKERGQASLSEEKTQEKFQQLFGDSWRGFDLAEADRVSLSGRLS